MQSKLMCERSPLMNCKPLPLCLRLSICVCVAEPHLDGGARYLVPLSSKCHHHNSQPRKQPHPLLRIRPQLQHKLKQKLINRSQASVSLHVALHMSTMQAI